MKTILRILAVLSICGAALAQQSYVKFLDSPGSNPYWDTNLANVLISNVTFHGKVTFISNSNSPSLWNTNGAGRYSPSDSFAQSLQFGSNSVAGGAYSVAIGTRNTNNAISSTLSGGTNNQILTGAAAATIAGGMNSQIGATASFSFIGGGDSHLVDAGVTSATIAGGQANRVRAQYTFIGGGVGNDARELGSTIVGGLNNLAESGDYIFLGGGNSQLARGDYATLVGGFDNTMHANAGGSDSTASVIVGGFQNIMGTSGQGANVSFIGGGQGNTVPDGANYSAIVGGFFNSLGAGAAIYNFIGGGSSNSVANNKNKVFIGGGFRNTVSGESSAILAGVSNNVVGIYSMAIGNFLTNTTDNFSIDIGSDNLSKTKFNSTGVVALKTITATNGFASYASAGATPTAITFPASDATWTNTTGVNIEMYIDNIGVTGTAVKKNGTTILAGLITGYTMMLAPGDYFAETYTIGAPTARYSKF